MKSSAWIIVALACTSFASTQIADVNAKKDLDRAIAFENKEEWNAGIEAAKRAIEEDPGAERTLQLMIQSLLDSPTGTR